MSHKIKIASKNYWVQILKGSLTAVSVALFAIFIFALVIRFASVPDFLIKPINQVIKVLSILFGVVIALKSDNSKGLKKGAVIGAIFSVIAYLVFSILSQNFAFDWTVIVDLIFACVIGGLCGMIIVNLRK